MDEKCDFRYSQHQNDLSIKIQTQLITNNEDKQNKRLSYIKYKSTLSQ